MINPFRPPPAPPAFGAGKVLPEGNASLFSKLIFHWLTPFLNVGFTRPLEKDDLWELPNARLTHTITDSIEANFYPRCPPDTRPKAWRQYTSETLVKNVDDNTHVATGDDAKEGPKDDDVDAEKDDPELVKVPSAKRRTRDASNDSSTVADNRVEQTSSLWHLPRLFGRSAEETKDGKASKPAKAPSRGKKGKKYDASLLKALHTTFFWRWWIAGLMKLCADTLKTTTPLVTRVFLAWLTSAFGHAHSPGTVPAAQGIGHGIGLAFALFAMQQVASLLTNHYMMTTMTTGLSVRTGIIGAIFRKSLRLSGRARMKHSTGQITTMISTDATRLDLSTAFAHNLWIAPLQIMIGIALLIRNLGYSALVGLGVLVIGFPLQLVLVRVMFRARKSGVQITDKRVRLTNEVLQGIRLVKFYAWEAFYAHRIGTLREAEVKKIRRIAIARASLISIVTVIPIAASVLSFITYSLSGHTLDPAIIFSSLQFFNIIRMPLVFFPLVLTSCSDALVALRRIGTFLTAEELEDAYIHDHHPDRKWAVDVDGDFTWETVEKPDAGKFDVHGKGKRRSKSKSPPRDTGKSKNGKSKRGQAPILPTAAPADRTQSGPLGVRTSNTDGKPDAEGDDSEKPFALSNLRLQIPKGAFVAFVGRVGSGKSSLLQSLVGEMRKTRGSIIYGGNVAYVPQAAWIMNATLRENILFGQPDDPRRFEEIVKACSLQHDIDMLPHGDQTEIGERGINLSGGQKARVSLARAAYSDADIVLMDDPLSAVDAHVGRAILENCLLDGPLASKTRVLATHALHVLQNTDYIYVLDNGVIVAQGTYESLMRSSEVFSRLIEEYGAKEGSGSSRKRRSGSTVVSEETSNEPEMVAPKERGALMSEEERVRGAVPLSVYRQYLKYAGGVIWAPAIILLLTLSQGSSVGNNLFLGFWTARSIPGFTNGEYMGVYAALGVAQAVFTFITSFTFSLVALYASLQLFKAALKGVLRSPNSFFDTTPMGRIMSRLSKDQDTLDTQLSQMAYQFLSTFSNVIGTVALVFYTFPLLGIIFVPLGILYYMVSLFYRRSSVETKRLDSLMRSTLYASLTETLTGLATVRAYGGQGRFTAAAERGLDLENRAYYMTVAIQRWLSLRLDVFGNTLILGIAFFACGFRNTVNPSRVGVVLTYSLSITQIFSDMVAQFAQTEQNMNAVERVLHYVDLPSEGLGPAPVKPPSNWPDKGKICFRDVELAYREGLPLVLMGVSFTVEAGEKVGIVGRTGAGKTSLLQALFRIVELHGGRIEIDNLNISDVELDTLRQRLALVPQDSTLFLGTLRENLDPQKKRTDAEIISALQRAWLLPRDGSPIDPAIEAKFGLDSPVSDEGSNFSAGEKQLLALCRALLKRSRIIVLDEATSSVDVETDAKLQRTIQSEFSACTLLCIAHRLNTIVYYDRILVMDAGAVAEFDTPLNLFDNRGSIFRSMCDEAKLTREDILRLRESIEGEVPKLMPPNGS